MTNENIMEQIEQKKTTIPMSWGEIAKLLVIFTAILSSYYVLRGDVNTTYTMAIETKNELKTLKEEKQRLEVKVAEINTKLDLIYEKVKDISTYFNSHDDAHNSAK